MYIDKRIALLNMEQLATSYTYDEDSFAPLYERLGEKIADYPFFGQDLSKHLHNVAYHTEEFMKSIGYAEDTAHKVAHAFALHDIGKIAQDPELWRITKQKRALTAEQKAERPKHALLGLTVLDATIGEIGMDLTKDQQAHIKMVKHLMRFHHERLDASGPEALPAHAQDNILRLCAVIDTVDGKFKAKGLTAIFDDMSGAKHAGQFDPVLVEQYASYYKDNRNAAAAHSTPVLANHVNSL